jgi:hypothetical protein
MLIKLKTDEFNNNPNVVILKSKLEEMQAKREEFKSNLDNGVDQVKEHCISLRNKVRLQTDLIVEQALQLNSKLIIQIDEYEKTCVDSLNNKLASYSSDCSMLLNETDKLYQNSSTFLTKLQIDDSNRLVH